MQGHGVLPTLLLPLVVAWAHEAYRPELASIGLDLSNAAYCERGQVTRWDCVPCQRLAAAGVAPVQTPRVFDGTVGGFGKVKRWGTRAVVTLLSEERISVAFRGSANITNWIEDFDFVGLVPYLDSCPACRVHQGFYLSWMSLARRVSAAVVELHQQFPKADILVTGHSLGAAQAVLAATHLYYNEGLPVTQVYTFGQPRVGNKAFHHFYNNGTTKRQYSKPGSSFRVVHWRDPIAIAPFRWMGFEHTSTEVWYNEDSTNYTVCGCASAGCFAESEGLQVCDGSGEDPSCSRSKPLNLLHSHDHSTVSGPRKHLV